MPKFYGSVGYAETTETSPGVWVDQIVERKYYGEVTQIIRRYQPSENLNDNLNINNRISILSDPYALQNFSKIKYVVWMDTAWKVSAITVAYPRLNLEIGGVYNGLRPETTGTP